MAKKKSRRGRQSVSQRTNSRRAVAPAPASGVVLGQNNYGKSRVRMVKVLRDGKRHEIREVDVAIALEGDFKAMHTDGDNSLCLPTDTMKNTVYALGKDHPLDTIEAFALHLGRHFVDRNSHVSRARVKISQTPWHRVSVRGKEHTHCFTKGSEERQTCDVTVERSGVSVVAGIEGLVILKSTDSAFVGYIRDEFTTLPETDDRIFATSMTVKWMYGGERPEKAAFGPCREKIRRTLIDTFAEHKSESVQHTLHAMGEAALKACPAIDRIRLSMPNKHCLLVNLSPFGMDNPNEIFVPTDEPHGLIEATLARVSR